MSTLTERLDGLPPERRQRVEESARALIAEEMSPRDLRKARETEALIREAVGYHLGMLRESGDPIPQPQATAARVTA